MMASAAVLQSGIHFSFHRFAMFHEEILQAFESCNTSFFCGGRLLRRSHLWHDLQSFRTAFGCRIRKNWDIFRLWTMCQFKNLPEQCVEEAAAAHTLLWDGSHSSTGICHNTANMVVLVTLTPTPHPGKCSVRCEYWQDFQILSNTHVCNSSHKCTFLTTFSKALVWV